MMMVCVHGLTSDKTRVTVMSYTVGHASIRVQALKTSLNLTLEQPKYFYEVRKAAFIVIVVSLS